MKGIQVFPAQKGILQEHNRIGTMTLKAKYDNNEVVHLKVVGTRHMVLSPYHCRGAMFVCYILKGRIHRSNTDQYFEEGHVISAIDLDEPIHFTIYDGCEMLFITSKPYFEHNTGILKQFSEHMAMIQAKDDYTEKHCDRVGNLAVRLGMELGLMDEDLEAVMYVGKVHDIGKIKIADEILNKPSGLTQGEFDEMKEHARHGYETIKHAFSQSAAQIALYHHERIDGSGYPEGLKGDDIPFGARILAVADCFDAMITDRPYRSALTPQQAFMQIEAESGTHFDPKVVQALKYLLERDQLIQEAQVSNG